MADAKHTAELDVTSSMRPMEKPHPDDATNRDSRDNKKITPQPEASSNQATRRSGRQREAKHS